MGVRLLYLIDGQIQKQHIHARFTQHDELRSLDPFFHQCGQLLALCRGEAPRGGYALDLQPRCVRADVRIEPAARSEQESVAMTASADRTCA